MPGTELSTFIQRLAKRVSCRMNNTNQEPHEGPRNLRAISRVVTEAAGGGLAPGSRATASPTDQEAWPKERPREPEVAPARPAFSGGTAPASNQASAGGGPGEWNHHPVPAFALAPLTHGVLRPCVWPALRPRPFPSAALAHWPEEVTPTLGKSACFIGPRLEAGLESGALHP